jgi:HD-GYP domain-containing protein (c-di-GMP phosphodiesterase class II)
VAAATLTTVPEQTPDVARSPAPLRGYVLLVIAAAILVGVLSWRLGPLPDPGPLALLCAMGLLSYTLKEPDVGSRIGFSFLSIILLASAAILGPFGAAVVGSVSAATDLRHENRFQGPFNMAMTGILGAGGAWAYAWAGGPTDLTGASGAGRVALEAGGPLMVANVVQCVLNAVLLAGVVHLHQDVPFVVVLRRVLATSGLAYVGYGVIGFLFVVLWYPAGLGPFSAVLVLAPLLAARWAFIQYGDELRSHNRTIDTLVTALGTKVPHAVARSHRVARLAEWITEEMGLGPHQIRTVRHAATLHQLGLLGVPTRILRRSRSDLTRDELTVLEAHPSLGERMIAGIDFLEEARPGIRHQDEWFDGSGSPAGLRGRDIPLAARVVAVASAFERLAREEGERGTVDTVRAFAEISLEEGTRFDPAVVSALRSAIGRHEWPVVEVLA